MDSAAPPGSRVSHYDYDLPEHLVARFPVARRDESRLLVVRPEVREAGVPRPTESAPPPLDDRRFRDIVDLLEPGDLLVVNESRVLPARLLGRKPTGAAGEVLLLRPDADDSASHVWDALVRPGSKLKPGRRLVVGDALSVQILDDLPGGGRRVRLDTPLSVEEALERYGHVPLPPYLGREPTPADRERYQTVYARVPGSVAAPTAGLHFTPELLERLGRAGVRRAQVTLHVGIGTFRPVEVEDPADHDLHSEWYEVPAETARAVEETRSRGGRIWAVGTTAVRTLEAAADADGRVQAGSGTTDLFVRPPYDFRVVQGLITNFHLPRSTLIMLVAALAGYGRTMEAYRWAVEREYRFYSYGDAMAITPPPAP